MAASTWLRGAPLAEGASPDEIIRYLNGRLIDLEQALQGLTASSGTTGAYVDEAGDTMTGELVLNGGGGNTLAMKAGALDHVYEEYYARTASPATRSGWVGYGSAATNHLGVTNEIAAGNIVFTPGAGGGVYVGAVAVVLSNDARLSDARTPTAHSINGAQHTFGGGTTAFLRADGTMAIPVVTSLSGFPGGTSFLRADGVFSNPVVTGLSGFPGGTTTFLRADGTFASPATSDLASAITADLLASAADTYLAGLLLAGRMKSGTFLRFSGRMTKTAAGTAAPAWNVRVGTAGTTADTARVTLTSGAQTAVVDDGWFELIVTVRTYATGGVIEASLLLLHSLATTGLNVAASVKTYQGVSAAHDLTLANLRIGLSVNPGASGAWTFQDVTVSAHNLA